MEKAVKKVWGREAWLANNELYCAKFLYLDAGCACSLHRHLVKDETFVVLSGNCLLEYGNQRRSLEPYDSQRITPGTWHRFSNPGDSVCVILEASTHHSDADVERVEPSRSFSCAPSLQPS